MVESLMDSSRLNYSELFLHLPMAIIVAKNRIIIECNHLALDTFRASREDLIGKSFEILYPKRVDFEDAAKHFAPLLAQHSQFQSDRIMRRLDDTHCWLTVRGYGFNQDNPYELASWVFTAVQDPEPGHIANPVLTQRERDVAALLVDGLTSKEAARTLGISFRTVDIHRASLIKKYNVKSSGELIKLLIG